MFANTPKPPYYIVSFTSQRTEGDHGYGETAERMVALAAEQPGFLGVESVRDADGYGITLSYWDSEASIAAWRNHLEHTAARERGRRDWYLRMITRVGKIEREYGFERPTLRIVPASADDRDYVWQQEQLNIAPLLQPLGLARDRDAFEQSWPRFQNFLLYAEAQRVGLIRWRDRDGRLNLSDLQVELAYRQRGYGSQALRQFEQTAKALGFAEVCLTVHHLNITARRLYDRLGYQEHERNEDQALLVKTLG